MLTSIDTLIMWDSSINDKTFSTTSKELGVYPFVEGRGSRV